MRGAGRCQAMREDKEKRFKRQRKKGRTHRIIRIDRHKSTHTQQPPPILWRAPFFLFFLGCRQRTCSVASVCGIVGRDRDGLGGSGVSLGVGDVPCTYTLSVFWGCTKWISNIWFLTGPKSHQIPSANGRSVHLVRRHGSR